MIHLTTALKYRTQHRRTAKSKLSSAWNATRKFTSTSS